MEEETNTDMKLRQGWCPPAPVWVGLVIVMTIVMAAGVSDIVLLATSNCSFHVEVIPIILTLFFVVSLVETLFIYKRSERNTSPLIGEESHPLISGEEGDTFATARCKLYGYRRSYSAYAYCSTSPS